MSTTAMSFGDKDAKIRDANVKRIVTVNITVGKIFNISGVSSIVLHYADETVYPIKVKE